MKLKGINFLFIILLITAAGCNPTGYVKVDVFQDLFKNNPPTLSSFTCAATSLTEGDTLSCSAIGNDTGDFTYRFSLQNTCGSAVIDADSGVINLLTDNSFVPGCTLSVEAFDGEYSSSSIEVPITVANTVPTLSIADVTLPEDSILIANDAAVQSSEGDNGVYALDNAATTGTKCSSVGTLSINAITGAVSLNAPNWVGSCNITVTYDDGNGGIASDQFTYTATGVNDGPIISGSCGASVNQDVAYNCSALSALDPEGDTITWELALGNDCSFLSIDSSTGVITGTPNDDQVGTCTLAVRTTDGTVYSSIVYSQTLTVNNVAPTLTISNKNSGDTIGPFIVATDAEVQSNEEGYGVYSLDNATTSGTKCSDHGSVSINTTNGEITFDGNDGWVGSCNIKVVFNDQNPTSNLVASQFSLTITDTVGPVATAVDSLLADGTYTLGSTISIRVTFNEPVNVTGTPKIVLETGFIDREASYVSGSGSRYLTFNYTVETDDFSSDLDVSSAATIVLNGGTLQDISTNAATLTLPVGGNPNSLVSLKNIVVAGNFPFAELSNVPSPIARTSLTDMTVGGTGVTHYKFKWGIKGSVDCSVATDYSAETAISQKITESLTSVVVGNSVVFCVVGKNSSEVWQPYSAATSVEWIKGEYSMGPISLAGLSNLPNWKDATIDSFGRIIARNARGEIFRSVDNGVNWQLQCKIVTDENAHFKIDPSTTGYTYVVTGGNIHKIEAYNGAPCPQKTSTITDFNYTYYYSPFDIDRDGALYLFVADSSNQRDLLFKSTDAGTSWTQISTLVGDGWSSSFAIDPNDKTKMIRFASDDVNSTRYGSYTSIDSGLTWTKTGSKDLTYVDVKYNPAQANSFYTMTGDYSVDGGANILTGSATNIVTDSRRFHIDNTGAGYFLQESGSNTLLRKTTNYGVAAHSLLYTFTGITSSKLTQAISARGSVIVALAGGNMYVSTNSGSSFSPIFWQGTKLALMTGITTKDGKTVYGVTADWNIVKSGDIGETWELKQTYGRGCFGKEPRIDTHELEANRFSVWANGSYCAQYVSSIDGGNTTSSGLLALSSNFQSHIYNPLDPNFEGFRSQGYYRQTNDGGYDWKYSTSYPGSGNTNSDGFHDSQNGNKQWVVDTTGSGSVQVTNQATLTASSVTTGLSSVAGMDAFINESGAFEVRVVDRVGKIRYSVDQGATFSDLGVSPALSSCSVRYFYTLPQNRNVMATICANGDDLTFTTNNGQTWRTIDFDGLYGINCDASAVALHPNKFFVACKSYDVLYVKYNAIELINEATDSTISVADQSLATPIVNNTIANEFASTEYAIIPLNGTCDGSLIFSPSVPLTNDPAFSASGNYQVCVKLTDSSSVVTYDRSPIIKFDNTAPASPAINLAGVLSDTILKRHELLDDANPIVSGITGTGFDKSSFAIVPSGAVCDNSQRYSFSQPIGNLSNQFVNINEGNWKVCLKLSDTAGNGQVFGQSANFTYSNAAVYSRISNLPSAISNVLSLNISVSGTDVSFYRYKVGSSSTVNCSVSSGYSSSISVTTPITTSLVGYKPATFDQTTGMRVCVVGVDNSGNWQPMKEATSYDWTLYRYSAEPIGVNSVDEIENWKNGWIDIHNNSVFYATDYTGTIMKSTNGGDSWTNLCRIPDSANSIMYADLTYVQSPYSDRNLYVIILGKAYRVVDLDGLNCLPIAKELPSIPSSSANSFFTVGPNGVLYIQTIDGGERRDSIYKSTNFGLSWQRTGGGVIYIESYTPTIVMRPDPQVPNRLFAGFIEPTRPDLNGIYRSDNDGATWTLVTSSSVRLFITPDYSTPGKWSAFNPVSPSTGHCTANNWVTITSCTRFNVENTTTSQNQGRFQSLNGDIFNLTSLNWATNMPSYMIRKYGAAENSSYTDFALIPPMPLASNYPMVAIEGSSIIAAASGRLYIATDGKTFKKIKSVNPTKYPLALEGAKNGGQNLMFSGVTTFSGGLKKNYMTRNYGQNWTIQYDPNERCYQNTLAAMGDIDYARYSSFVSTSCSDGNFNSFSEKFVTKSILPGVEAKVIDVNYPERGFLFGPMYMAKTASYWQHYDYKNFVMPYLNPSSIYKINSDAFVDPRDSNKFFMLTVNQFGDVNYPIRLGLVDYENSTWNNLTANSNFPVIAGLALANDGSGGHYLYTVNHEGKVERSDDYGASFTIMNNTALTSGNYCNSNRKYYVDPDHHRYQQTTCNGDFISVDGGQNFARLPSSFTTDKTFDGCTIHPKFFDGKNLYLRCALGYLKLKLSDFELDTFDYDRNLDDSERGTNLPLLKITEPGQYSSIEYAVVLASVTCDNSLSYSSTIPTTMSPAFSAPGAYKVCVRYNDGTIKFTETSPLNYTSGAAVFTSVALANSVTDGVLSENEKQDGHLPIVTNLVASNYNEASYRVADSGSTCSSFSDYRNDPPLANLDGHFSNLVNGSSYKVCVRLINSSGAVYGASSNFIYEENFPRAELVASLGLVEKNINLTSAVTGTDVTHYKFKYGRAEFIQCASDTNYSSEIPVATQITLPLASAVLDKQYKLCLVGKNSLNKWQPLHLATEHSFFVNKFRIRAFSPGSFDVGNWLDVAIHDTDPLYMALLSYNGDIYRTRDGGATWNVLCKLDDEITFTNNQLYKILIANDASKTIYLSASYFGGGTFVVEDKGGAKCTKITSHHSSLDSSGRLYSTSNFTTNGNPNGVYRTADRGATWTKLFDFTTGTNDAVLHVNRNDNNNIIVVASTASGQIFETIDGGLNWVSRSTTGILRTQTLISSPALSRTFFQPMNGVYTPDGGTSVLPLSGALAFRADGKPYRLRRVSDSQTVIETNTDVFNAGSWTNVYTFNDYGYGGLDNIVVNGNTIAVTFARRLYLSTDAGATFTAQNIPVSKFAFNSFERTPNKLYGLTNHNVIFESSDNGATWNYLHQIREDVNLARSLNIPSSGNGQFVIATLNFLHTSNDSFVANRVKHNRNTYASCFYENIANPNQMLYGSQSGHVATTDGYATISVSAETISNTCFLENRLYMNPADTNFVINSNWSTFVVYNMTSNTSTPLVTGLPNTISDIEMYEDGGNYVLRAIDSRGTIRESLNFGTTFTAVGPLSPYPVADSISNTKMNSEPTNRDFILNHSGQAISYTFDGGLNWETQIKVNSMQTVLNCNSFNDVIPFNDGSQKALIACSSDTDAGRPLVIEF